MRTASGSLAFLCRSEKDREVAMSQQQMKNSLIIRIVALGICSTPFLAHAYVKQLTDGQVQALVQRLTGSKIEKAILVASATQGHGGGGTHV
jgi:hypothetical protein